MRQSEALGIMEAGANVFLTGAPGAGHWVDIMDKHVDKGEGVKAIQRALGVTRAQTAAFGDYLNDIGMLNEAEFSFAMANAHEGVKKAARYLAPANTEEGVIRVVDRLVG